MSDRLVRRISTLAALSAWTLPSRTMTFRVTATCHACDGRLGKVSAVARGRSLKGLEHLDRWCVAATRAAYLLILNRRPLVYAHVCANCR